MRRVKGYHILFTLSLATLVALAVWWFMLHFDQISQLHADRLLILDAKAQNHALRLGGEANPPPHFAEDSPFEIVPLHEATSGIMHVLAPHHPGLVIQVKPSELNDIQAHYKRRVQMISGEGSLLMILVLICVVILYRLFWSERRTRQELEVFFHAVSHELKTPVAGVRALLETLSSRELKREELQRYAGLGLRETSRLQRLIENVLIANRIDRHLFSANPKHTDLRDMLERFVSRRNAVFSSQPLSFEAEAGADCCASADADLLLHVVGNLVDNAFKYSPEATPVTVHLHPGPDGCIIDVLDGGIGFDPADAGRLFDKFERGQNPDVRATEGSGLGLFIARELIRAMGGTLTAHSEGPGRGARFRIKLKKGDGSDATHTAD